MHSHLSSPFSMDGAFCEQHNGVVVAMTPIFAGEKVGEDDKDSRLFVK